MASNSPKKSDVKYKAYLIFNKNMKQVRWVFNEIPEEIVVGTRTFHLKMVLWNCNNKLTLDKNKFVELQALIYR